MKKNVLIGTARNGHVRASILNAKEMVEEARKLHDLWPTSCAALGRTLAVTALMALRQKDEGEVVTVTINGNGPIGTVLCVGQSNGQVKGFCGDPHIYETYPDTHKLAVGKAVGTDLLEGKPTLPVIYAMQDKTYGDEIRDLFEEADITHDHVVRALKLIAKTDSVSRCLDKARFIVSEALRMLDPIPDSIYKDSLLNLASFVVDRDR